MMTLAVFMNTDSVRIWPSELLLSVSPVVGGGVASFAYAIATRGAYLDNIDVVVSNRQVLH